MDVRMLHLMASDVSLTQPANKSFLTIKMRMMTTKPNRNNEGVTEAFIDDMIARGDALKCLGLFADKAKLLARDYDHLTHMYDKQSGEYRGDQVGSFFSFEKVNDEFGVSLYGVARIPKSRKRVCTAITEMWEQGKLSFSFEISYTMKGVVYDGETMYVDAHPDNILSGMTIVSVPAYPEAVALDLAAEVGKDNEPEEVNAMNKEEMEGLVEAEVTETEATVEAEVVEEKKPETEVEVEVEDKEEAKAETTEEVAAIDNPAILEKPEGEEAAAEVFAPVEEAKPAPVYITTEEYHSYTVRTEQMIAERDAKIANLESQLAAAVKEVDDLKAEKAENERLVKVAKAEAYAKKHGLDLENEDVKSAVASANFEMLAELDMQNEVEVPVKQAQPSAMFAEMNIPAVDKTFGGLLRND